MRDDRERAGVAARVALLVPPVRNQAGVWAARIHVKGGALVDARHGAPQGHDGDKSPFEL